MVPKSEGKTRTCRRVNKLGKAKVEVDLDHLECEILLDEERSYQVNIREGRATVGDGYPKANGEADARRTTRKDGRRSS